MRDLRCHESIVEAVVVPELLDSSNGQVVQTTYQAARGSVLSSMKINMLISSRIAVGAAGSIINS